MKIERRDGGGFRRCNRNQRFKLEALLALVVRHQLPSPSEKWVGRQVERCVQAALFKNVLCTGIPSCAPREYSLGFADPHHFALVKHRQAGGIAGGLIPEYVTPAEIERYTSLGERSAQRRRGISRIACGRDHHHVG